MAFLGVMGLVKDKEIDVPYSHETIVEAIEKDLGGADDSHVFSDLRIPESACTRESGHVTVNFRDLML
jgi:hypothetical protein